MKNFIRYITKNLKFITAILLASLVGGLTTNLVRASVPDSSGIIHACRNDLRETVSIIDTGSSESCGTGETALSWNDGPQVAHVFTNSDGTLDTSHSTNIVSSTVVDSTDLCLNVSFEPALGLFGPQYSSSSIYTSGDPTTASYVSDICGAGYNADVIDYGTTMTALLFK